MKTAHVGPVELCYELSGEETAPVMMLVSGLGGQLVSWHPGFVELLEQRGFRVLRFDNRDSGLSSSFDGAPGFDSEVARRRDRSAVAYTLDEMADDAAGLLDALLIDRAHVVGVSMGGMIAQTLALGHRDRVLSLCSIMSTTGAPDVGQPTALAMEVLMRQPPEGREDYLEAELVAHAVLGSPGFATPEHDVRAKAALGYDRSYRPQGTARQLMAILVSGDRTAALRSLDVPTVVIHGDADQLVTPSGGEATARAIPAAKLVVIPGMGHELPEGSWPAVVESIVTNASLGELSR